MYKLSVNVWLEAVILVVRLLGNNREGIMIGLHSICGVTLQLHGFL